MKIFYFFATFCAIATGAHAQNEPIKKDSTYKPAYNDTIRIGSILIVKKHKAAKADSSVIISSTKKSNRRKSTNYFVFDFGFSNFTDHSNYGNSNNYIVNKTGAAAFNQADFKLQAGKSINVNVWFLMQTFALVKNNVNLKYGLGVELNNYRFRSPISFKQNGLIPYSGGMQTNAPFVFRDSISFSKNKLSADYLTVPLMLNFASTKKMGKPILTESFGVSAGYLYSQRNKQKSNERGKQKNKGNYDMEKFKISYVGEVGLGSIKLYGSYSPKSIFERGIDIKPYNIGIRFSN